MDQNKQKQGGYTGYLLKQDYFSFKEQRTILEVGQVTS